MKKEDIIKQIDQLAEAHNDAEDLNDAELIELQIQNLIRDFCLENRYEVNGFPFKLTDNNIDVEEYCDSIDISVVEAYEQYVDFLVVDKDDVAELMWNYTKTFWPGQFDSKAHFIENTKAMLEGGFLYDFKL